MELYYKHYIVVDSNNHVIKGYSDIFEQPMGENICINQEGGRHFELLGTINPPLIDINHCHLYKYYDNCVSETTELERVAELETFQKPVVESDLQAEYLLDLDYRLSKLELGV